MSLEVLLAVGATILIGVGVLFVLAKEIRRPLDPLDDPKSPVSADLGKSKPPDAPDPDSMAEQFRKDLERQQH